MAASTYRVHFRDELARLEGQALGALDLVVVTLDRTLEALHHRDIELASIVIVTHNMQQAACVSDMTALFTVELDDAAKHRTGHAVEYDVTDKIFTNPEDKRTEDYVTGKFG